MEFREHMGLIEFQESKFLMCTLWSQIQPFRDGGAQILSDGTVMSPSPPIGMEKTNQS